MKIIKLGSNILGLLRGMFVLGMKIRFDLLDRFGLLGGIKE